MDTDEIILWVCLGVSVLLVMLFLVFAITTGGVKAFALYILFPLFIISFLVGMVLLVQLIIKLNDKLDDSTSGLNKKIDTNNFMIKDSIVNVDDFLQNVDYTVIIEDRNIQIDPDNPEDYGTPFRYKPKVYEPSLVIPGVTGPDEYKNIEILTNENIKTIPIENFEVVVDNEELDIFEDNFSLPDSLSIDETIIEEDLDIFENNFSIYEDDNETIFSEFYISNIFEIKPLHEEFLNSYNIFEE